MVTSCCFSHNLPLDIRTHSTSALLTVVDHGAIDNYYQHDISYPIKCVQVGCCSPVLVLFFVRWARGVDTRAVNIRHFADHRTDHDLYRSSHLMT